MKAFKNLKGDLTVWTRDLIGNIRLIFIDETKRIRIESAIVNLSNALTRPPATRDSISRENELNEQVTQLRLA